MSHRVYDLVRSIVEGLGGSMIYEHQGYRYGAWIITLGEQSVIIEAGGDQSFPVLDRLFIPKTQNPKHWDDYKNELVPEAKARLLSWFGLSEIPENETEPLAQRIARTKWKFAWTYARTYPHEYTTKALCNPDDHAKIIECIENYGIIERFGGSYRKYFYNGDRKYWHMGEPDSEDPEKWPNVINRTWVDVRRHSQNVKHVWTAEEVELQMRLWEIQLEKSTDRPKLKKKL